MRFQKRLARVVLFLFLALSAAACQGEAPAAPTVPPTWTPFPTSVPLTDTPQPTVTLTLLPSSTPLPTFTLAPSLTPVPTKSPTPGIIGIGLDTGPFRDDFSNPNSGWPVEGGANYGFGYYEGGYRMYNNTLAVPVWASRSRSHTDYVIEVDVEKLSGPDSSFFGVTCRTLGTNYYSILINGDGQYSILRAISGEQTELASGISAAIRQGNQENHLVASCIGNTFSLSVNGVEVGSVQNTGQLFGSFIGLILLTATEPGIEVKFDNFDSYPTGNAPPIPTITPTGTLPTPTPSRTPTATP